MENSRTKNSFLTMSFSGIKQVLTILLTFVSRTVFIYVLGEEYLGLNGLFSNILSLLALTELGIDSAVSFYLYKPLANHDTEKIRALMRFYKICYRTIGAVMLLLGLAIMPLLPYVVNLDQGVPENLYLIYYLYVINTAITYLFFAYKQVIVTANQQQYKIEKVNIVFTFLNCFADITVLLLFRSYTAYLLTKVLLAIGKNIIIAHRVDAEYPYIKEKNSIVNLSKIEIKSFFKDMISVSMFRIGSALYNSTDNIIISMLLGTAIVGYYSNYYMIISGVTVVIGLIVRSFCAGVGNLIAKETSEKQFEIFSQIDFGVYSIVTICTACLFQLLNSFIKLWIGGIDTNYILPQSIVLILCIDFYINGTTQIMNAFREASGNFRTGRTLQLLGGLCNIVLSFILGRPFGLAGIFAATILCKGIITVIPFIIGISKNVFGKGRFMLLFRYGYNMLIMLLILATLWIAGMHFHMGGIVFFIVECCLSIIVPSVIIYVVYKNRPEAKALKNRVMTVMNNAQKKVRGSKEGQN